MFELHITQTGKSFSPKDNYTIFAERKAAFGSLREVYQFLRSEYGKTKRVSMYMSRKDGSTIKCGWIICFRNADYSHAPVEHWLQQDWVELRKSETVAL